MSHREDLLIKERTLPRLFFPNWFALLIVVPLVGCSGFATRMADNISAAVLNQNDPETVRAGAPSYLILIDSLIAGDPEDSELLLTGARLYSAYAGVFVSDTSRKKRLATKALDYARRATCQDLENVCNALDYRAADFTPVLADTNKDDVPVLYTLASAWLGWMQASGDDWNAVADLPKVTAILMRVEQLNEAYDNGGVHTYLGVLNSQLPPALGGKPEIGQSHFEKALKLSNGTNLMTKVLYARHFARLTFDQALHDRLLREVLAAKTEQSGLTLINTFAQQQAAELLESGKEYF